MDETTLLSKCVSVNSNEVSTRIDAEDMGFEKEVWPGIHIVGIVLFVLLGIIVVLCCCIRFRVPRTKQEIEADYIRKRITKNFRNELSKISNTEMNEMDLWKALDRIRNEREEDTSAIPKECAEVAHRKGFRTRFNAVLGGMRVRFNQQAELSQSDITI
ncbi:hypothetical protein PUN28_016567 [Cardiocondyla obscurior]|uniref:Transmembrane inner ear expressed protein n=1 Tax=Cardiocondyla obscurior TaxID=286306 RepID=A0AAW2ERL9_9HYME